MEGRCYRHRCTGPNRYQIQTSDSGWVDCPAGGAIQVTNVSGLFWWSVSKQNHLVLFLLRWKATTAPFSAPTEDCAYAGICPLPLKTPPPFPPPSRGKLCFRRPARGLSATCNSHVFSRFSRPCHDVQNGTGPRPVAAASLCIAAAACVLAAAVASSRKWISCGVRIHSAPVAPANV